MAITTTQQQDLLKLGVGMFNASVGGYIGELAALVAPATGTGMTMAQLYEALANSTAFKGLNFAYSSASTNAQFSAYFTSQILGTSVSATNLTVASTYIQSLLDGGQTRGAAIKAAVDYLSATATLTNADFGAAAQQFVNKVTVATDYTITKSGSSTSLTTLQSTVSTVTDSAASVTAAISGNTATTPGETKTFTTSLDVLATGSGNDTFIGDYTTTTAADQADGGAGTDTLKLYPSATVGAFANLPTMTNIENLYLNSPTFAALLDVSAKSTITSITLDNEDINGLGVAVYGLTIAGTQAVTLTAITDSAAGGDEVNIGAASTVTAHTLTVDGVGSATLPVIVDITGTGVATLNLVSANNASTIGLQGTAALKTLNITGDKALSVDADTTVTPLTTVSASGMTAGGATVTLDDATARDVTFTGSPVNDAVRFGVEFTATDSADGGAGTDTIGIADGGDLTKDSGAKATNFEILDIRGAVASTYDLDFLSGITTVSIGAAVTGNVLVQDMATTTGVSFAADPGAFSVTLRQKDAGAGSPDDSLTVTLTKSTALTMNAASSVIVDDIETLNLVSSSTGTSITHTIDLLKSDESTKIAVGASTAALTINELDAAAMVAFDASAAGKAVTLVVGAHGFTSPSGVGFTGGAGKDTFTLTAVTDFSSTADDATVIITGGGAGDITNVAGDAGAAGDGHTDGEVYTFKFAAGDSISKAGATAGFDANVTDTIAGFEADTAFAAGTDGNGSKFTLDTEVSATAVTFSVTAATLGTTQVTNAGDFYVYDTAAGGIVYVYQDTDGDKLLEAGEFAIKLVADASAFTAGEFTVASGNLVYTSA